MKSDKLAEWASLGALPPRNLKVEKIAREIEAGVLMTDRLSDHLGELEETARKWSEIGEKLEANT